MRDRIEILKEKIVEIIRTSECVNEDFGIEIYTDYRDRDALASCKKEIFNAGNPEEKIDELISQWEVDYAYGTDCGYEELWRTAKNNLSDEWLELYLENETEMEDFIRDKFYFYYDRNELDCNIHVNIMIDCGNMNTDYTQDNVLNYYGKGKMPELSSVRWLAKQQGKEKELEETLEQYVNYKVSYENIEDKFCKSCIQEFENLSSYMGTLTFMVKMPIMEVARLIELKKENFLEEYKYNPINHPCKSYIELGKETVCGLFDTWSGAGSVLEIELEKNVQIPLMYCKFCPDGAKVYGYDIDEVYGLIFSCWKDSYLGLKEMDNMVALTRDEYNKLVNDKAMYKRKAKELEKRVAKMQLALLSVTSKGSNSDVEISLQDFLDIYDLALNIMFDTQSEDNDIYGYPVTVHWHGMYCDCSDGATPSNHIIPAIQSCLEEIGE